ncbi:MAG: hypothetical protein J6T39_02200, partial [Clostridia bacterium]|nr:hypothetical protein [Clostridia bacterium]
MEFEDILKKINKTRPFKMYMHCSRDGRVIEPVFDEHENFRIMYGRGNIYSSFVNCGTTNTDFVDRFKNYYYAGSRFNVIMTVPDDVQVSNYC